LRPGLRSIVVAVTVLAGLFVLYFARHVMLPFLLAGVIAYTLNPVVSLLERTGVRRAWAIPLVLAGLVLVLAGVVAIIVPEMIGQVRHFSERLPGYTQALLDRLRPFARYLPEDYPQQLESWRREVLGASRGVLPAAAAWVASSVQGIMSSLIRVILWMVSLVIIPVFAYYFLSDHKAIGETVVSLIPSHRRPAVEQRAREIDQVLRAWLKGQLTVALLLAVIYAVGLSLLGVPLGLLIGIIGGLANLVPYLGIVVGFLPAALLSFLESGWWGSPLLVAGVFILGQVLEGTLITPRIVGSGLGLPPALVLLSVLVGGDLFGFTGLMLAVPTTAALLVLLRNLRESYETEGDLARNRVLPLRRRRPVP